MHRLMVVVVVGGYKDFRQNIYTVDDGTYEVAESEHAIGSSEVVISVWSTTKWKQHLAHGGAVLIGYLDIDKA